MRIKKIKLKNIRSYLDETIEFPQGSVLLGGDIGSGKSTILLAIDFALFGLRRGELAGGSLLRSGKKEGGVELYFEIENKEYIIKRTLVRKDNAVVQDAGYIIEDETKKDLTATELKSYILDLLGYPQELLTKSKSLIYRYTVYTPQEGMKLILLETNEERLDTLRRVFGIDKYKTVKENAKIVAKEIRRKISEFRGQILDLNEKKQALDEEINNKREVDGKIRQNKERYDIIKLKLNVIKEDLERYEKDLRELALLKERAASLGSTINEKGRRKENVATQIDSLNKRMIQIEGNIAEESKSIIDIVLTPAEIKKQILELEQENKKLIREASLLDEKISSLKKILEEGICGTCEQRVADPKNFENSIISKGQLKKQMEEQYKLTEDKIDEKRQLIEKVHESMLKQKEVEQLKKSKAENEETSGALKKEKAEIEDFIAKNLSELDGLVKQINELAFSERIAVETKIKKEQAEDEKLQVEKEGSALNQQLINSTKRIEELNREINAKEEAKGNIGVLNIMNSWLTEYFVNLMDTIEKHVMIKLQQEFNEHFKEWLKILVEDEYLNAEIDENFTPIIEQNGSEIDYNFLSGGEKTSIALAYRLALNKVINTSIQKIKTRDLLILDEPTDGFSTQQLDKVRDVLNELKFRQIIIVSHEPKIESFVENQIKIIKEGHVSKVL